MGCKAILWRKDVLFNKWSGTTRHPHSKQNKTQTLHVSHVKINSKCFIDLNVKCNTNKLVKDDVGENLGNTGFGDVADTCLLLKRKN